MSYQPHLDRVHFDVGNMIDSGDPVLSPLNIHEQLSLLAADLVIAENLKAIVGEEGDVRLYEPLAKHTTLRVEARTVLGRAAWRLRLRSNPILPTRNLPLLLSDAAPIFSFVTAESVAWSFIRPAAISIKWRSTKMKSRRRWREAQGNSLWEKPLASAVWNGWKEFPAK